MTMFLLHHGYVCNAQGLHTYVKANFHQQVSLFLSCVLQTVSTTLGFGKAGTAVDQHAADTTRLVSLIAGFFLIIAAAWSKTSFAITLLRLSDGRMKKFIWFVILSTNLVIAASGVFQWVQCWPLEKLWRPELTGMCLRKRVVNGYNIFTAGM
jgi:hypothetical protein